MTKIFISYQRESEAEARELYQRLTDAGFEVWQDVHNIRHTDQWSQTINSALNECDRLVLLMTPKAMESREVYNEWFYFYSEKKPLHCLLVADCKIHFQLKPFQYLDWQTPDKRDWARLFTELRSDFVYTHEMESNRLPKMDDYCRVLHQQSKQSNLLMALSETDDFRKRTISIDEVYTPLYLQQQVKRAQDGKPLLHPLTRNVLDGGKEDKDLSPLSAMEATNAYPRLVLLGDPGSGKTIFMNYLALCMTGAMIAPNDNWMGRLEMQGWTHGIFLPISIILRDFASGLADNTFKAVFDHLKNVFAKLEFGASVLDAVKQYAQAGKAIILFDGLDEVPPDKRDIVRDAIHAFMERFPNNRYIITCRILSYADPKWHLRDMDAVETFAPLNNMQITHFVNAWYTVRANLLTITRDDADKRIIELTERLNDADLQEMASNPMLLTVMTFVHNSTGTLPKEKARLYDQCVDWLMRRWKLEEFNTLFKLLNLRGEKDLYKILWEIAYDAHSQHANKDGVADINESDILAIVRKHVNHDMGLAQKFCEYVQYRAGLLIGRGLDNKGWRVFTFPHRTFQEFLAGQYLLTNDFEELAPKIARLGAGWHEVMILASGYLIYEQANDAEVIKAAGAILDDDPTTPQDWRAVWLAGEMLSIVKTDNLTKTTRGERVLKRAKALLPRILEEGHLPVMERASAGRVLSILGDPRKGVGVMKTTNGLVLPDIVWCHIPAGDFIMGSDDRENEKPIRTVHVPDFYMSRYLVTYTQYSAFENADDFEDDRWWDGFPDEEKYTRFDQTFQYGNHPRDNLTWYDAMAFGRWLMHHLNKAKLPIQLWDNNRKSLEKLPHQPMKIILPSEAEYEKSARGTNGQIYPYGNDFDPDKCNSNSRKTNLPSEAEYEKSANGTKGPFIYPYGDLFALINNYSIGMTNAVGLYPDGASPYGVLDTSGNVWKWTRTNAKSYDYISDDEAGITMRYVRGGSWASDKVAMRAFSRFNVSPNYQGLEVGFFLVFVFA